MRKLNSQFFLKHKKKQKKSQIRHCQIDEVGVIIIQLINDTIRKAAPVKKVTSSHTKGEAVVLTDEPLDIEAVKAAVHATGYEVTDASSVPYEKKKFSLFKK